MKNVKNLKSNYFFVILFMMLILLPVVFFNHTEGKVSKVENKVLASKPNLFNKDGSVNKGFIQEYEAYINDNLGLKQEALIANLIGKYHLFGIVDIPNWLQGKDDNFFYTTGGVDIDNFCGRNYYTSEQMHSMMLCLQDMNQYFKQMGCQTYNMFIPNKEAIYSELYDPDIQHATDSRQDIFIKYIRDNGCDINIIDTKSSLLKNRDMHLYYKAYDASHWNMNGAFIGYLDLMEGLKKNNPNINILKKEDFSITEDEWEGLMSYYSSIDVIDRSFDFKDTIYNYELKGGYHATLAEYTPEENEIDPNLNYYHFVNNSVDNDKDILIVGDSYMYCFLLPMIAESFENVYFIRNTDAGTIINLSSRISPDIFLYEIAERVFFEDYYTTNMSGYQSYLNCDINMDDYVGIDDLPEFHIDSPQLENNTFTVHDGENIEILGWAFDSLNDKAPQNVYMKIGDSYRKADFYYREDLAAMGEKYSNCGFKIVCESKLIKSGDEISFFVISDKDEVYRPYCILIR